jgi:hypothetical protein
MATDPWYSDSEDEKVKRRQAADNFLKDVLNDATNTNGLYDKVLADHALARTKFAEKYKEVTGLALPDAVVVACKMATTDTAANIVLFNLPPKGTSPAPGQWDQAWVAAWPPYPK